MRPAKPVAYVPPVAQHPWPVVPMARGTPSGRPSSAPHLQAPRPVQTPRFPMKQAATRGYLPPPVEPFRSQSVPRVPSTADGIPAQQPFASGVTAPLSSVAAVQSEQSRAADSAAGNSRDGFGHVVPIHHGVSVTGATSLGSSTSSATPVAAPSAAPAAAAPSESAASNDLLFLQQIEQLRAECSAKDSSIALYRGNEERLNRQVEELTDSLSMADYELKVLFKDGREESDRVIARLKSDVDFIKNQSEEIERSRLRIAAEKSAAVDEARRALAEVEALRAQLHTLGVNPLSARKQQQDQATRDANADAAPGTVAMEILHAGGDPSPAAAKTRRDGITSVAGLEAEFIDAADQCAGRPVAAAVMPLIHPQVQLLRSGAHAHSPLRAKTATAPPVIRASPLPPSHNVNVVAVSNVADMQQSAPEGRVSNNELAQAAAGSSVPDESLGPSTAVDRALSDNHLPALSEIRSRTAATARGLTLGAVLGGCSIELQLLLGWSPQNPRHSPAPPVTLNTALLVMLGLVDVVSTVIPLVTDAETTSSPDHMHHGELYSALSGAASGAADVVTLLSPVLRLCVESARPRSHRYVGSLHRTAALRILLALLHASPPCRAAFCGSAVATAWLSDVSPTLPVSSSAPLLANRVTLAGKPWDSPARAISTRLAAALPVESVIAGPSRPVASLSSVVIGHSLSLEATSALAELGLIPDQPSRERSEAAATAKSGSSRALSDDVRLECAIAGEESLARLRVVEALVGPWPSTASTVPAATNLRVGLSADVMLVGFTLATVGEAAAGVAALLTSRGLPGVVQVAALPPARRTRGSTTAMAAQMSVAASLDAMAACTAALRRAEVALSIMTHCAVHPLALAVPSSAVNASAHASGACFLIKCLLAISQATPALSTCLTPSALSLDPAAESAADGPYAQETRGYALRLGLATACASCQLQSVDFLGRVLSAHRQHALFAFTGSLVRPQVGMQQTLQEQQQRQSHHMVDGADATASASAAPESRPPPPETESMLLLPRVLALLRLRVHELMHLSDASRSPESRDNERAYTSIVVQICVSSMRLLLRIPGLATLVDSTVVHASARNGGGSSARAPLHRQPPVAPAGLASTWELTPGSHVTGLASALMALTHAGSHVLEGAPELATLAVQLRQALQQRRQPQQPSQPRDAPASAVGLGSESLPPQASSSGNAAGQDSRGRQQQQRLGASPLHRVSEPSTGSGTGTSVARPVPPSVTGADPASGSARKAMRMQGQTRVGAASTSPRRPPAPPGSTPKKRP